MFDDWLLGFGDWLLGFGYDDLLLGLGLGLGHFYFLFRSDNGGSFRS
jgi:hypothetical protein